MTAATSRLRRRGIGAGVAALVGLTGLGFAAVPAQADATFNLTRPAATGDRFETAASVATAAFPTGAANVIIANGDNAVDALAASYLAGSTIPILYTKAGEIPPATLAAWTALKPTKTWVVGGTAAVSDAVYASITGDKQRIAGADRFETAVNIGKAKAGTTAPTTAFIVRSDQFADALAIAPVAAKQGIPVLLTETGSLNATTAAALSAWGIKNVTVVGGPAAVSENVRTQLTAAGVTSTRVAGGTRTETAVQIANTAGYGFGKTSVYLVNGFRPVDALPAAVAAAKANAPIILTEDAVLGADATKYLTDNKATLTGGVAVGGTTVLPATVETAAETAAGAPVPGTSNQTLAVTPAEATTLTSVDETGSAPTTDDRQYTVSGLTAGTSYVVKLVPTEDVATSNGRVTFVDDDSNNIADANSVVSTISVLNGAATDGLSQYRAVPVNGSISFTVDSGDAFESVTPVVFVAQTASTNFNLPLDATDAPSVAFGVGGSVQVLPAAGTNGDASVGTIEGADKTGKWIATTSNTYKYDSNDRFYVVDAGETDANATDEVSLAEFENVLTTTGGDSLIAGTTVESLYLTNSALQSTFILVNDAPVAPDLVDATDATASVDATDTSAAVSVDEDTIIDGATVNVYIADETDAFEDAELVASATTDADANTDGFQVNVTGLTDETSYEVYLTQTVGSEESSPNATTAGAGTTFETTATPDSALTATSASITGDVNNGTGDTTTFAVTFSKALVSAGTADTSGVTVTPAGQSDYVIDVAATAASVSTDNKTVTFTVDAATLEDATTDITYNVRIPAGTFETADGPNATLTASFKY